jgi:hypothetical protein
MKQRRLFIRKLGGVAALLALAAPGRAHMSKTTVKMAEELEGNFVHVVFFWLVDDAKETREKFLSELLTFIDNMDLIKTRHIGTPADTDREVIDNTWSYSLVLSFDSKKEHDIYQEHQLHKDFIENASSLWTRVQVYDSVKTM